MKRCIVLVAILFGVLIGDRCLSDQDPYKTDKMNNGRGWKDWEMAFENRAKFVKLAYLNGVFDAMRMAYLKAGREECANQIRTIVQHAFKVRYLDMMDAMSTAVSDKKNEHLPLPFLWELVCQKLNGSVSNAEYKKRLAGMRKRYSQAKE